MQKYRADRQGETCANGAIPWHADWIGGPSLALVKQCPVNWQTDGATVTAYVTGEADTWFSIPAVCRYLGRRVKGYITTDDFGYVFHQVYY